MTVDIRGQVAPMREMFHGLAVRLGLSVGAFFLLLMAYFQSARLALVSVSLDPADPDSPHYHPEAARV